MATAATSKRNTAAFNKRTPPRESLRDLEEEQEIDERKLRPGEWESEWRKLCNDTKADQWAMQELIPAESRDECLAYLYRLEPKVFNATGEGSNIGKYSLPLTEETIRSEHGGGKYKIWLKRGPRDLPGGQRIFVLAGQEAILRNGQIRQDGRPVGEPGQKENSTVEIIREVAKLTKPEGGNNAGIEATVGMMQAGFKGILEAQAAAAASPTGNKGLDAVLPALLQRALEPSDPFASFAKAAELIRSLQPPAPPAPVAVPAQPARSLNDEFAMVKEIAGVDSIADLFKRGKGPEPVPWFAPAVVAAVQNIPNVLNFFAVMSEKQFQRNVYLAGLKNGQQPAEIPASVAEPIPNAPTIPVQPIPVAQTQEQLVKQGADDIVLYFTRGFDGGACAVHLMLHMPAFIEMLRPALGNRMQLGQIVAQIPPLAQCAQSQPDDWNDFVNEFVQTIQQAEAAEGDESQPAGEVIPIAPSAS